MHAARMVISPIALVINRDSKRSRHRSKLRLRIICAVILALSSGPRAWAAAADQAQGDISANPAEVLIRVPASTDSTKRQGGVGSLGARTIAEALQARVIRRQSGQGG